MRETLASSVPMVDVAVPAALHAQLQASAEKLGLSVPSYLELLQAIQSGHVSLEMSSAVREIFTGDREILKALAR